MNQRQMLLLEVGGSFAFFEIIADGNELPGDTMAHSEDEQLEEILRERSVEKGIFRDPEKCMQGCMDETERRIRQLLGEEVFEERMNGPEGPELRERMLASCRTRCGCL
jgi:hypothetical protein